MNDEILQRAVDELRAGIGSYSAVSKKHGLHKGYLYGILKGYNLAEARHTTFLQAVAHTKPLQTATLQATTTKTPSIILTFRLWLIAIPITVILGIGLGWLLFTSGLF